ncbi:MAG: hypothetical protein GY851_05720, partial [bacterium]|nr:hypothetical protein [bacterium]
MQFVPSLACIASLILLTASLSVHAADAPEKTSETNVPTRAVTRGPEAHWFGYYDKHQFDETGRYLLGMMPEFEDRPPTPEDQVRLGYVDLQDGDKWTEFATSCSWGWQQGCM